jgi:arylformamidase
MTVDYEAEYNNRARVPEHADIFARWAREGAEYRAEATAENRAELGLRYGPGPRQTIDLFSPPGGSTGPVAVFIHGGYWRSLDPSSFSQMARGLNARGLVVAVPGYDLCPHVRIGDIIAQMRQSCLYLWRRFGRRLVLTGHSAGGHLTACMMATDWKAVAPDLPADLVPAGLAVSGLYDLTPLLQVSMNQDLRITPEDVRAVSPIFWPPPRGTALDAWCGALESNEFLRQNRIICEAWGRAGVETNCREIAGTNHFTVIDALADANSEMTARMVTLSERTQLAPV